MCGLPPPKSQQNEKTVGARYTTDKAQSLLKSAFFRLFRQKYFSVPCYRANLSVKRRDCIRRSTRVLTQSGWGIQIRPLGKPEENPGKYHTCWSCSQKRSRQF